MKSVEIPKLWRLKRCICQPEGGTISTFLVLVRIFTLPHPWVSMSSVSWEPTDVRVDIIWKSWKLEVCQSEVTETPCMLCGYTDISSWCKDTSSNSSHGEPMGILRVIRSPWVLCLRWLTTHLNIIFWLELKRKGLWEKFGKSGQDNLPGTGFSRVLSSHLGHLLHSQNLGTEALSRKFIGSLLWSHSGNGVLHPTSWQVKLPHESSYGQWSCPLAEIKERAETANPTWGWHQHRHKDWLPHLIPKSWTWFHTGV